jgi:hypothetical protein
VPKAALGKDRERAADLAQDRRQGRDVVGQQAEVGHRPAAQVFGNLVGAVLPAAGFEDLWHVVAVERPQRVVDFGVGLAAVRVEREHRLAPVLVAHGLVALLHLAGRR